MRLDIRREMTCFVTKYLNINRILLLAIGMWPYQQSQLVQLQITLYYGILMSIIIVQLTSFLTIECTSDVVMKVFSTILYFLFGISALFIAVAQPWLPLFLNTFLFINVSQTYASAYIITEYFIDEEKYFYLILLHMNVVFCLGTFALIATGTMFIVYIQCTCAIFKVASYRIERAMDIDITRTIDLNNEIKIYNGIIHAVDIHRKAMMLFKFFLSTFDGLFCCMFMCIIICLSLNLFQVFQIITFGDSVDELIVHAIFICVLLLYVFISNYFAQEILDHNSQIFATVYNTRWYTAPLYIQKMILFLLQRGTKPFTVDIGGLYAASLESTTILINTSMSYFTVLCSTRR
ncbi:odorant receptor 4-like [Odontomachus brunneus]|uniref:odorant receptor 4-like n=1 Tax=Odontomachus brunneus TaxID=486640 RepID=UPI0013F1C064|nr:odorant receptor 4-like [Odontomachus brunneus]